MDKKEAHIHEAFSAPVKANDFDEVRFIHDALGGMSMSDVDLRATMAGRSFPLPLYINAMTGGTKKSEAINRRLALLAKAFSLPMAVGSLKRGLEDDALKKTYTVIREVNPDGVIVANIGAEHGPEAAKEAVTLLKADMLQIHLNPVQELIMPEGDRDFKAVEDNIRAIVRTLDVPVIVKEVGFGLAKETLVKLKGLGVETVDLSGRGGTNFARIENSRRLDPIEFFNDWGLSTVESLLEARSVEGLEILASGGIRTPLDAVKALRLGASMVGMSGYFLRLVENHGPEKAHALTERFIDDIKRIMTALGAKDMPSLSAKPIVLSDKLLHYLEQR